MLWKTRKAGHSESGVKSLSARFRCLAFFLPPECVCTLMYPLCIYLGPSQWIPISCQTFGILWKTWFLSL